MGRRRGKSLKAHKKRIAAAMATAAENVGSSQGYTNKSSSNNNISANGKKRAREESTDRPKRSRPTSVRESMKISNQKKRRCEEEKAPAPRMTIAEALQRERDAAQSEKDNKESAKKGAKKVRGLGDGDIPAEECEQYVGLDCEMVGTGDEGKNSVLARACVVDWNGTVLYDSFVKVKERITDFRTQFSGVRAKNLKSVHAVSFRECAAAVAALLKGKILVGHALHNDLKVLLLSHPASAIRDTARYRPLMRHGRDGKFRPRKLRDLAKRHLDMDIQGGEHTPDEDARVAILLYRQHRREWEASLRLSRGHSGSSKAMKAVRQAMPRQENRAEA